MAPVSTLPWQGDLPAGLLHPDAWTRRAGFGWMGRRGRQQLASTMDCNEKAMGSGLTIDIMIGAVFGREDQ
jgi:hypothetical protein